MDEKICKLFLPLLDRLYHTEPAGEPFRTPVDVVKYNCPNYYDFVKHPIDLTTIRNKLISLQYKDPWRFVADVQLMFSNAYLYNKRGTLVYDYTNKLNKIWTAELTPIMQRLNYCCGTLHKFGPQLLFCHGTTPDKYCQIPIGAKYRCYRDQYSFCMPCFNKIETDYIDIQALSASESTRMKSPTQPVKKIDLLECTNDAWQYETFIECTQCTRRVHQICELYPASDDEISDCVQHDEIEEEQKLLCQPPVQFRTTASIDTEMLAIEYLKSYQTVSLGTNHFESNESSSQTDTPDIAISTTSLDDELLQFAQAVEDSHSNISAPTSPNPYYNKKRSIITRESSHKVLQNNSLTTNGCAERSKNSVDSIAARLAINKMTAQGIAQKKPKFACNHCYRKKNIGFDLRHRKYSARRLPHTRMSEYIEKKVNEYIRLNSPSAGQVTIRVLTAYRDTIHVKKEMRGYVNRCRETKGPQRHSNSRSYPNEFGYTNRAIFAWQEIDGVDVCVFGMHVQEYGEDCPEPNKQVVYLSYLDSVHFFRPKELRTVVYHEILLTYFKYVKELGFRRVFIWVCPSRKGDDYIFYRHPPEQKMPTQKRLFDWYVKMLDLGIRVGIIEKYHNIHQYSTAESWTSILSMPYLSGDYWPGEFERLLTINTESQMMENFDKSLKRQRDGFIVARLNDCDCSPHFESQRRMEETTFTCDLMRGREPFLQLARRRNYEFSTLRRAKFSSLAMVKHLERYFNLEPIFNECYTLESNKRHYDCSNCEDFYLCTPPPSHAANNPPPSHIANNPRSSDFQMLDVDQILVENFITHAEVSYDLDFDQMKNESRKILAHYWSCPMKETCHRCKFVVLSCSFMSRWMRSSKFQSLVNCNPSGDLPNSNNNSNNTSNTNSHLNGINLTTAHRLSYQPKDR